MCMKFPAWLEGKDETFMPQTDQLYQVTGLRVGGLCVQGHAIILPQRLAIGFLYMRCAGIFSRFCS